MTPVAAAWRRSRSGASGVAVSKRGTGKAHYPRPLVFVVASITDTVANWATDVVRDLGLPGIFVLMTAESACIPIPSEATMLFAGFNVSNGEYSLFAATAVGVAANLVGAWGAFWGGYLGRGDILA